VKVFLQDVPYDGLEVEAQVSAEELGLINQNFVCLTPLAIEARFDKVDGELLAQIVVQGSYEVMCARCLAPVRQNRKDEFELTFDVTPETEFVEYGDGIRQELVIGLSVIFRCQEDCRGLCPKCGVNLNTTKCRCKDKSIKGPQVKIQLDNNT